MIRHRARLAAAAGLLLLVEVALRTLPLPTVARLAGLQLLDDGRTPSAGPVVLPWWAGARVAAAQRVVARWPFEGPCLRESLVAGCLLRRFDPTLRIGVVRAGAGPLRAHAWIEVGGATFDSQAPAFVPLQPAAVEAAR